ncbi:hypothetical protein AK812_SmicGene23616 [Symbiodinium microadriaticum]|uniref:Uncharacterized protein n=1 Tax=Symbiodinium microadriaticum TaxID=2951 RepID=A0A1Q9DGW4_SYMMI|nr:hypothetical protein AK812_SmicGene23616 [Symbiodinium microadriaticum]
MKVSKYCETATVQTQAQCRDWVDTALARLETLAVRTREQLGAFAEELPFTVRRWAVDSRQVPPRRG